MAHGIWRRRLRQVTAFPVLLLLVAACGVPGERPGGPPAGNPLIVEVYAAGLADGGADQYIRLYNPLREPVDLAGWSLGDGKMRALFPPGARIGPGQTYYAARSAAGFAQIMAIPPDAVWGDGPTGGALRMSGAAQLRFTRASGLAVLRNPAGQPVDQVAWGDVSERATVGWKGSGAPSPAPGEVLDRARDELGWSGRAPGSYKPDTDTAADWKQGSAWVDRRILRPGQTFFAIPTYTVQSVTAYASPDSAYEVLTGLIDGARERIDLNVYNLTNLRVAAKLAEAARRGVVVRVLLEASSVGGMPDQERFAAQRVHEAGGQVRWMMNQPGAGIFGRYVFNHAKYGVFDGRAAFVQSENIGYTGVPIDASNGNRGWGVVVRDHALAGYLSQVFAADWNPGHGDIFPYREGSPFGPPGPGAIPEPELEPGGYPRPFPPLTLTEPVRVTPVLAPDHALLESKGITGLIRSARRSILVEQLYIYYHWGPSGAAPERHPNLFLQELLQAARRGVKVRILLADTYVDPSAPKDNAWTAAYINRIAGEEGLDLQARLMRTDLARVVKLHNKGLVVDGERVLISSINWSLNSPANNREVGLILEHPAIGQYYTDIFTYDWYNGWPAEYPLITEVDATQGYLELSLFTPRPVDLGGWAIATTAGTWHLPPGTALAPHQPLIIAHNAGAFAERFGAYPNLVELPGLILSPSRDRVELRSGPDLIDRLAWGGALPGWALSGHRTLCRNPAGQDTNTYLDWTLWSAPSPGAPGCGR